MNLPLKDYLKRKNPYEAADSGILLWRKDFAYFIVFFAIPFWICAFLFRLLPGKNIYLSWLFLWWLKPFFDRIILHIVSVRFFEPKAGFKRLLKGIVQNLFRGLFGDLLWRRLSPFRAASMPIRILESKKKERIISERKKLLNKGGLGYCFLLSFWGAALEIALLIGELLFLFMMSRFIGIEIDISDTEFIIQAEYYIFALWCFNYILTETIYVCMGFGVYINSRIDVEGWDIEIVFKNLANKIKKKKLLGLVFTVFFASVFFTAPVFAESVTIQDDSVPLDILNEIYASPDFGSEKDSWEIKLKNPPKEKEEEIIITRYNTNKLLRFFEYLFAAGLRIIIVIFALIAAFLIVFFARIYLRKKSVKKSDKPALFVLKGMEKLDPQELLKNAMENKEDLRLAWGYCTAAAILLLQSRHGIVFPPNATENDCVKIACAKLGETEEVKSFSALIFTWIKFVYAGTPPSGESFDKALTFCNLLLKGAENG